MTAPLATHVFLLAVPVIIAALAILQFVRGGRRDR